MPSCSRRPNILRRLLSGCQNRASLWQLAQSRKVYGATHPWSGFGAVRLCRRELCPISPISPTELDCGLKFKALAWLEALRDEREHVTQYGALATEVRMVQADEARIHIRRINCVNAVALPVACVLTVESIRSSLRSAMCWTYSRNRPAYRAERSKTAFLTGASGCSSCTSIGFLEQFHILLRGGPLKRNRQHPFSGKSQRQQ